MRIETIEKMATADNAGCMVHFIRQNPDFVRTSYSPTQLGDML